MFFGWLRGANELAFLWLDHDLGETQPPILVTLMVAALGLSAVARLSGGRRGAMAAQALNLTTAWLALVSLTSFAYGHEDLEGIVRYGSVGAISAALSSLILALAMTAAATRHGLTPLLLGDTMGSRLARRLLPAVIVIMLAIGAVRVAAQAAGLVSLGHGTALFANVAVALLIAVVWRTGASLADQELARRAVTDALEASERNLSATLYSIAEAVIATDERSRIVRLNRSAERLTGWSEAEAVGRHLDEIGRIVDARTRESVSIPARRAICDETPLLLDGELLLVGRSGEETPVADSTAPIRTAGGRVCGVVVVFRETTAEVEARKRWRDAEERLLQKHKMEAIGRLAGGVAHDFNNLLSIIVGYGERVTADLPEGKPRQRVQEMVNAGKRAAEVTRQLLAFSRQQVVQPEVLDVNRFIGELQALLRHLLSEDVSFEFAPAGGELAVEADRGQLTQVLLNLVANARDAMLEGGALTIATEGVQVNHDAVSGAERPGDYVRVSIADTGIGMDDATRQRIFEPFFTTKAHGRGTGLGLATVFGIVEQSAGFLRVRSAPGEGSRFDVYLPRATQPVTATAPQPDRVPTGQETVLLVEDEPQVRAALGAVREGLGYRVLAAPGGAEALELLSQQGVDVLLTDLIMPHMTGRRLIEAVRRARPELPVIAMSGHARGEVGDGFLSAPRTRFLQKPLSRDQLARAIREVVDSS